MVAITYCDEHGAIEDSSAHLLESVIIYALHQLIAVHLLFVTIGVLDLVQPFIVVISVYCSIILILFPKHLGDQCS